MRFKEGFTISGSDSKESDLTKSLEAKGMRIFYGQCAENIIPGIDLVVYTAAIREDNPEFAKECMGYYKRYQLPELETTD